MSESFWSLSAAKRSGRQLVPGTSRWVANELNVIDLTIVNETNHFVLEFKSGVDQINDFMARVGELYDPKDTDSASKKLNFLRELEDEVVSNSPTRFVNHLTPLRKTDVTSVLTTAPASLHSSPMVKSWLKGPLAQTPSPLKLTIAASKPADKPLQPDLSFIPASTVEKHTHSRSSGADDSFQAISTAIRKSIAGKLATNSDDDDHNVPTKQVKEPPKSNEKVPTSADTRKPLQRPNLSYKTPNRSSLFVSLPSKEPFTISSKSVGDANRYRSLRLFEKLELEYKQDVAAGQPTASTALPGPTSIPRLNSHYIRKSLQRRVSVRPVPLDSALLDDATKPGTHPQIYSGSAKEEYSPVRRQQKIPIPKLETSIKPEAETYKDIKPVILQKRKLSNSSPARFTTLIDESKPKLDKKDLTRDLRMRERSPILSSIGDFVHRSRNVFMKSIKVPDVFSPKPIPQSNTPKPTTVPSAPILATSSRAARSPKNTMTRGRSPVRQLQIDKMRRSQSGLNSGTLLTRSRDPSPDLILNQGNGLPKNGGYLGRAISRSLSAAINTFAVLPLKKGPELVPAADKQDTKHLNSPTKGTTTLPESAETKAKTEPRLEHRDSNFTLNSRKKKSIMAERSEAAASRPKQKIKIGMSHKVHKIPSIPPPLQLQKNANERTIKEVSKSLQSETMNSDIENHRSKAPNSSVRKSSRAIFGNGRDTFGKEASLKQESFKHQTVERLDREQPVKGLGNAVPLPDAARGRFHRTEGTVKRRRTAKEAKSPFEVRTPARKVEIFSTHDQAHAPKTPAKKQYSPESLPVINTDDEDNGKHPVLSPWAETPQLLKLVQQTAEMDPVTIFGEIPKLRIEEIFDSQASRHRARPSPGG